MLPLVMAVVKVMVSPPVPPISVSMLLTVPVFGEVARVSLLLPVPRSTVTASVSAVASVMVSIAGAGDRVGVAYRGGVGAVGEGQAIVAGTEADAGTFRQQCRG